MSPKSTEANPRMRPRVLIVEDEGIVAKDLQKSLEKLNYEVCGTSSSGEDAVRLAKRLTPDIMVMDVRLRGKMDGIDAARQIRQQLDVPVVFLTAYADDATLSRAREAEPYAYILKPFDDRELHVTLTMALRRHRAFAELDQRVQERTAELAHTAARYYRLQAVTELGLFALGTSDTDAVVRQAVSLVADTLDLEFVKVLELVPDGSHLLLRAGVGWKPGLVGTALVPADHTSQAGYTLEAEEAVVVPRLRDETRFSAPQLLVDHAVESGVSVIIHAPGPNGRPFGVLGAHCRTARSYSDNDVNFLQTVANFIATAIMRAAADAKILQAERLAQEERTRAGLFEDALRARDEFLSVAAHELRTPVSALQLNLETLRELLDRQPPEEPRISDRVAGALKTAARLGALVEGILDVPRMAQGNLELTPAPFDLSELVLELAAEAETSAARAGCKLHVQVSQPLEGSWDRRRIRQVVANLLSNALKFGAGQPVDIIARRDEHAAVIIVEDHGRGLDPNDAQRIMNRFERAVSHQYYGGLGLGLYVAAQIVQSHGGTLKVTSAPGEGAAFVVTLPYEPPERQSATPEP